MREEGRQNLAIDRMWETSEGVREKTRRFHMELIWEAGTQVSF